jgi:hypothetical protein
MPLIWIKSVRASGVMTNRKLAYIVRDQKPLVLGFNETASRLMWERRTGSVLIVDTEERSSLLNQYLSSMAATAHG